MSQAVDILYVDGFFISIYNILKIIAENPTAARKFMVEDLELQEQLKRVKELS